MVNGGGQPASAQWETRMTDTAHESIQTTITVEVSGLQANILERPRALPVDRQMQVGDFIEFLAQRAAPPQPHRGEISTCAEPCASLTDEEIEQARGRGLMGLG